MSTVADQALAELRESYIRLLKLTLTGMAGGDPHTIALRDDGTLEVVPAERRKRRKGGDWPVNGLTMIGFQRLDSLQHCVEDVLQENIPGDLIETGVWRGGASIFMRALLKVHGVTDRKVYVADSFEGFPEPARSHLPEARADYLSVSLETVQKNFKRLGMLDDQVEFVKGWFSDTLPGLADRTWALIRLDGDLYDSTMDALVNLYPGLSPGGFVIIDDYSVHMCRDAVNDFRAAQGIEDEIHEIDWTGVYWRKGRA
jgi:Macrocin-O-methyltransferase (TylF)